MNKIFATIILILASVNLVYSQDGFVRFNKYTDYRKKTIKCFKGEIVPYKKTKNPKKIDIKINDVIINQVDFPSADLGEFFPSDTLYFKDKQKFVEKSKEFVYVNTLSIPANDSVILVSEQGNVILKTVGGNVDSVKTDNFGVFLRLIIKNAPSIYYPVDKLLTYDLSAAKKDTATTVGSTPKIDEHPSGSKLLWWHYLLICLVLAGAGFGGWTLWQRKKSKPAPTHVKFEEGYSLTKFVSDNGGVELLNKLNPTLIPSNLDKSNPKRWDEVKNRLAGQMIQIREDEPVDNDPTPTESKPVNWGEEDTKGVSTVDQKNQSFFDREKPKPEDRNSPDDSRLSDQIPQSREISKVYERLETVEKRVLDEIKKLDDKGNSNELTKLKSEAISFNEQITQLQTDKDELTSKLANATNDQKNSAAAKIKEKIIEVNFLKAYCDEALLYLKLCNRVLADAYNYFDRVSQQNLQQALVSGNLLMKFQNSVRSIPTGNWIQIVQDIADTGITANKQVRNSFEQLQNDEERMKREFCRLLFENVLVEYSSNVLILAEAFRNLKDLHVSSDFIYDTEYTFSTHVSELVSKVRATGLENKYVPLFINYGKYLGLVTSVNNEKSVAYKGITGWESGTIIEIVSYGVKTEFEDTKTLVILA